MRAGTFATLFLLVACLFSSSFAVVQPVQAATACEGEVVAPEWNTTAQRLALVPHGVWGSPFMFEEMYEDDMEDGKGVEHLLRPRVNLTRFFILRSLGCTIPFGPCQPLNH